jgi:hypothetical protein
MEVLSQSLTRIDASIFSALTAQTRSQDWSSLDSHLHENDHTQMWTKPWSCTVRNTVAIAGLNGSNHPPQLIAPSSALAA